MDEGKYQKSLEVLRKALKEDVERSLKNAVTLDPFSGSLTLPTTQRVYARLPIICEHKETTILIQSDEDENKTQKTICNCCGNVLYDDESISNIKI